MNTHGTLMPGTQLSEVLAEREKTGQVGAMAKEEAAALAREMAAALGEANILHVGFSYAGSGGSVSVHSLVAMTCDGNPNVPPGSLPEVTVPHTGETISFSRAMDVLAWHCVDESGHRGWENEAGGSGSLAISADGTVDFEHADDSEKAECACTKWAFEAPVPAVEHAAGPSM
ncbi:DUF6878 family protein [Geopseudomonas aromaticivorans]